MYGGCFSFGRLSLQRLYSQTKRSRAAIVLGIETSCDDTAVAIVAEDRRILSNVVFRQFELHAPFEGIVPRLASANHRLRLPEAIKQALDNAMIEWDEIDAIAATRGPGIVPCLSVGFEGGRLLASALSKPFYPIHHMEAHAMMIRQAQDVPFPFLCLLASGGHTLLAVAHDLNHYSVLGTTLDDAAGEAFDKVARMLGIPFDSPSGPAAALEVLAKTGNPDAFDFPLPFTSTAPASAIDFSFSGLKTAVKRAVSSADPAYNEEQFKRDIAASFQKCAATQLGRSLKWAIRICRENNLILSRVVFSGGVARNDYVKERYYGGQSFLFIPTRLQSICEQNAIQLVCPSADLCVDNGAMVAWLGIEHLLSRRKPIVYTDVIANWSLSALKQI